MSINVKSNRFQNKDLNNFDVMQHIRNIYDILGVLVQDDMTYGKATNVVERLDDISKNPLIKGYYDTVEEYQNDLKAGIISPDDLCYIEDDEFDDIGEGGQKEYVGNLTGTADKAVSDQYGNNIANTYVTKDNSYAIGKGIEFMVDSNGILSVSFDDGIPEEVNAMKIDYDS